MKRLDMRGLSCPIPLMKTKEAMDAGAVELEVVVDEPAAWENISKLAISQGWQWVCSDGAGEWTLTLRKNA